MNKQTSLWVVGGLCLALAGPVLGQAAGGRTVGFAQDTLANDWRKSQADSLRQALEAGGGIKVVVTDAGGDSNRQVADAENLLHQRVDVLVTSPRDGRAMAPVLSQAYRQGKPVVLLTRSIPSDDYTTLIGADDQAIGRQAARFMASRLKQGNILVLQGVPTASTAIARNEGFLEELRKHPGLKVSASKVGNYQRADAIRAIEEVLVEGVPFDAIYAHSDSMAAGARLALRKNGRDPSKLVIVGIDYISETREAIRKGEQTASFTYPTAGKEAGVVIRSILAGKKVPKRVVVDSVMVTADNVEQVEPIF